jgi:hypothetical protein
MSVPETNPGIGRTDLAQSKMNLTRWQDLLAASTAIPEGFH